MTKKSGAPTAYSLGRRQREPVFSLFSISDFFLTFLISEKKKELKENKNEKKAKTEELYFLTYHRWACDCEVLSYPKKKFLMQFSHSMEIPQNNKEKKTLLKEGNNALIKMELI